MLRSFIASAAVLATAAFAQTTTDCSPLNGTCPPDVALGMSNYTWTPQGTGSLDYSVWNNTGGVDLPVDTAMHFTMREKGNAPTVKSQFYYFFGTTTVIMKASPGTGVISALTSLSDDLDEIDFEFKGGNDSYVFTNFYGKYIPDVDGQGSGTDVHVPFDPRADYHNYTTFWSRDTLQWWIDGNMVREVKKDDPATKNYTRFPQTPMQLKIGTWAGGDSTQPGTVVWAGGKTDYSKGPFDMAVKSIYVSDSSSGASYTYSNRQGTWQSISIENGTSHVTAHILNTQKSTASGPSLSDRVANLSPSAKIGIAVAAISVAAIGLIILTVCCIKQRRAGRKERAIADAEFQKQEAELNAYRRANHPPGRMPALGYEQFKGKY